MSSFAASLVGKDLGGYRVSHLIGEGGMAVVMSAENSLDPRIRRALKVIKPEYAQRAQFYERFAREALVLEQLRSQHVVAFHGLRQSNHLLYMELELLEGFSLDQLHSHHKKPSLHQIIEWLHQAALGLAEAHKAEIVHRDIKPANLYIHEDNTLKLLDFGIAKVIDEIDTNRHTTLQGHVLGSPAFMAPEVCEGKESTKQADTYGLALIGYQLILGHHPFVPPHTTLNTMQVMLTHLQSPLPSLQSYTADFPKLEKVLSTAAARDARLRYRDGIEFAQALQKILDEHKRGTNVNESIELFGELASKEPLNWISPLLTFLLLLISIFTFQHEWHSDSAHTSSPVVLYESKAADEGRSDHNQDTQDAGKLSTKEILDLLNITWISLPDGSSRSRSISKTEVTVKQYKACVEAGSCQPIPSTFQPSYGQCTYQNANDSLPMTCVTFEDAKRFAHWVNQLYLRSLSNQNRTLKTELIVSLPSYEDWLSSIEPNPRPWGHEPPSCQRSVFFERSPSCIGHLGPQPVCSRPEGNNANGACDIFGNVWEWIMPHSNSSNLSLLPQTVGGAWSSAAIDLRKDGLKPRPGHIRNPSVGIRLLYLH